MKRIFVSALLLGLIAATWPAYGQSGAIYCQSPQGSQESSGDQLPMSFLGLVTAVQYAYDSVFGHFSSRNPKATEPIITDLNRQFFDQYASFRSAFTTLNSAALSEFAARFFNVESQLLTLNTYFGRSFNPPKVRLSFEQYRRLAKLPNLSLFALTETYWTGQHMDLALSPQLKYQAVLDGLGKVLGSKPESQYLLSAKCVLGINGLQSSKVITDNMGQLNNFERLNLSFCPNIDPKELIDDSDVQRKKRVADLSNILPGYEIDDKVETPLSSALKKIRDAKNADSGKTLSDLILQTLDAESLKKSSLIQELAVALTNFENQALADTTSNKYLLYAIFDETGPAVYAELTNLLSQCAFKGIKLAPPDQARFQLVFRRILFGALMSAIEDDPRFQSATSAAAWLAAFDSATAEALAKMAVLSFQSEIRPIAENQKFSQKDRLAISALIRQFQEQALSAASVWYQNYIASSGGLGNTFTNSFSDYRPNQQTDIVEKITNETKDEAGNKVTWTARRMAVDSDRIDNPATPRNQIRFDTETIRIVLRPYLAVLPEKFRFVADNLLSRKDHPERAKSWAMAQPYIQNELDRKHTTCEKSTSQIKAWLTFSQRKLAGKPVPDFALGTTCRMLHDFAKFLGADLKTEPRTLADVWPAFRLAIPDSDTLERLELEYRKVLITGHTNYVRFLDAPLRDIGVDFKPGKRKFDDEGPKLYHYIASTPNGPRLDQVIQAALQWTKKNLDQEFNVIATAQSPKDLASFIIGTKALELLFEKAKLDDYLPGVQAREGGSVQTVLSLPQKGSMLDYHLRYADKLTDEVYRNHRSFIQAGQNIFRPFQFMIPIFFLREAMIRTAGFRLAGATVHYLAQRLSRLTMGYGSSASLALLIALSEDQHWAGQLEFRRDELGRIKGSQFAVMNDKLFTDLVNYQDGIKGLDFDLKASRRSLIYNASFWSVGLAMNAFYTLRTVNGVYRMRFGTTLKELERNRRTPGRLRQALMRDGARKDLMASYWPLKTLGVTSRVVDGRLIANLDVSTLHSAMIAKNSKAAEEAYYLVVSRLGNRASQALGNKELQQIVSMEFFGSPSNVRGMQELANEASRMFPDLIRYKVGF
jgi:hypothetical protein